ncbi:hypothetical protein IW261DRAFT_808479 [Armillaria novae-zelandiae]|uniref:Uncharacterized protein n=1 Tax=Armillaria novae-zelandiae TaxID=153914 RepID=A0AA39NVA6_9AGAR|nr:hypothetical protein IW261DRAFT_808479 [Armillaria novae-zelandiae]
MISKTPFQVTLRTAWAMLFTAFWVSTEFAFISCCNPVLYAMLRSTSIHCLCLGPLESAKCLQGGSLWRLNYGTFHQRGNSVYRSLLRLGNSTKTMELGRDNPVY